MTVAVNFKTFATVLQLIFIIFEKLILNCYFYEEKVSAERVHGW
jgi:hypothetical protein